MKNKFIIGVTLFLSGVAIALGLVNGEGILFIPGIIVLCYYTVEVIKYLLDKKRKNTEVIKNENVECSG